MRIYGRFEVKREVGGSPNNLEYEATDMLDGSAVTLLEWTPEPGALAAALTQLGEIGDGLTGVEAFSQGTSLYLAAVGVTAAAVALRQLRSSGLFLARWPGFDAPEVTIPLSTPINLANPYRPSTPAGEQAANSGQSNWGQAQPPADGGRTAAGRKRSPMLMWALIAAALIAVLLGAAAWVENQAEERQRAQAAKELELQDRLKRAEAQRHSEEVQAEQAKKDAKALADRLSQTETQRQREQAEAEAAKKEAAERQQAAEDRLRQTAAQRQRDAEQAQKEKEEQQKELDEARQHEKNLAEQKRQSDVARKDLEDRLRGTKTSFDERQNAIAATLSTQYHRIRLIYSCPGEINVAIHFQGLDQNWVTEGWWRLGPYQQKVADPAYSQNSIYYFYAKSPERIWQGHDSNAINLEVVENPFVHITGAIQGINRRVVKAFRQEFPNTYGEQTMQFPCSK